MASGSSLRRTVGNVLKRLNATAYPVYFRDVATTGGDPLLGTGGVTTITDTLVDPQPAVDLVPVDLVAAGGEFYQPGDYRMIFAGTIDSTTLHSCLLRYGEEVLRPVRIDPVAFGGVIVAWEVTARLAQASG